MCQLCARTSTCIHPGDLFVLDIETWKNDNELPWHETVRANMRAGIIIPSRAARWNALRPFWSTASYGTSRFKISHCAWVASVGGCDCSDVCLPKCYKRSTNCFGLLFTCTSSRCPPAPAKCIAWRPCCNGGVKKKGLARDPHCIHKPYPLLRAVVRVVFPPQRTVSQCPHSCLHSESVAALPTKGVCQHRRQHVLTHHIAC